MDVVVDAQVLHIACSLVHAGFQVPFAIFREVHLLKVDVTLITSNAEVVLGEGALKSFFSDFYFGIVCSDGVIIRIFECCCLCVKIDI
jgi:hypothetical protein